MEGKTTFQFEKETQAPMDLGNVFAYVTEVIEEWEKEESKHGWGLEQATEWLKAAYVAQVTMKHCINIIMDAGDPEEFVVADAVMVYGMQHMMRDLQDMIRSLLNEDIELVKELNGKGDGESASSDETGPRSIH